jgi:hypothetical protein
MQQLPSHDPERTLFQEAYVALLDLLDPQTRELVRAEFGQCEERVARGEPFQIGELGAQAIQAIARHMYFGVPLDLVPAVGDAVCRDFAARA